MENVSLVRGKHAISNIENGKWIQGHYFDQPLLYGHNSQIYLEDAEDEECSDTGWVDIDRRTIGKFTGLVEDIYFIDADVEPKYIFEGDILEIKYKNKLIRCEVAWEICGFLLGSGEFEDSFIWLTEVIESDGENYWAEGAKIIGNKIDNPELLK